MGQRLEPEPNLEVVRRTPLATARTLPCRSVMHRHDPVRLAEPDGAHDHAPIAELAHRRRPGLALGAPLAAGPSGPLAGALRWLRPPSRLPAAMSPSRPPEGRPPAGAPPRTRPWPSAPRPA